MSKEKKTDVLQYDKRVMHRYLAEGKISQKDVEQHLANLADLTDESEDIAERVYGDKNLGRAEAV